jgi:hypothetical protein
MLRFHTQTAGVLAHRAAALNNIVRTRSGARRRARRHAVAAHQLLDEALALPTEEAVRVALRTQQIIAHETGVTNTIDPLGGSYFVEALTDRIEQAAYDYFRRIDELGGWSRRSSRTSPSARSQEVEANRRPPGARWRARQGPRSAARRRDGGFGRRRRAADRAGAGQRCGKRAGERVEQCCARLRRRLADCGRDRLSARGGRVHYSDHHVRRHHAASSRR